MDALARHFERSCACTCARGTSGPEQEWGLTVDGDTPVLELDAYGLGVFSLVRWARGAILGELEGTVKNLHEVYHDHFMFLEDDVVLDVSGQMEHSGKRSILTYINEDNATDNPANCRIMTNGGWGGWGAGGYRYFLVASREIFPGEEVVYSANEFGCWTK